MRRLALVGLLLTLPFVAVPLVWAATSGGDRDGGACAVEGRADRPGIAGEPSEAPVRWDAYAHAVPAARLAHNLRHGGIAVQYGARVRAGTVRQLLAWYRRDPVAVVVAPSPQLGDAIVLSSWSGDARCAAFDGAAFSNFRESRRFKGPESPSRTELAPARAIEKLRATRDRITFIVSAAAGVSVEVLDAKGRIVRRLGHFTVAGRQQLVLAWDGRSLAPGRYLVAVTVSGENRTTVVRAPFDLRRLRGANDADRQPVRQPRNA